MYSSITDINECDLENDGCQQICINTNGSYNCSCNPGYTLNTDGQFCTGEHYMINVDHSPVLQQPIATAPLLHQSHSLSPLQSHDCERVWYMYKALTATRVHGPPQLLNCVMAKGLGV